MSFVFRPLMAAALIAIATPVFAQTTDTATKAPVSTMSPSISARADAKAPDPAAKLSSVETKDKIARTETSVKKHHHKMVKTVAAKTDGKTGAAGKTESTTTK